jgi:hypothetical protein
LGGFARCFVAIPEFSFAIGNLPFPQGWLEGADGNLEKARREIFGHICTYACSALKQGPRGDFHEDYEHFCVARV